MGALRQSRRRPRGVRVAGGVVLAVLAVGGAVACDPAGAVSSATVSYTTDQLVTKELERQKAEVSWLTCNASYDNGDQTPSSSVNTVATVNCEGKTDDGQDITVKGKVTRTVSGACVRGDLTATVGGKQRFHVQGLGDCTATPTPRVNNPQQPGPTVTVTVTKTIWCKNDPQCWPDGK
ncbi:hypothetical protein AB0D34_34120 [Streptomyces sp. NPDC048420]|uniref:hypothetical protein n=1 Tax=Streptomyces sp. NPDC048420 TaxID=3155755 RepID=UPI00343FC227